jgi:hypothetical protein
MRQTRYWKAESSHLGKRLSTMRLTDRVGLDARAVLEVAHGELVLERAPGTLRRS